MMMLRLILLLLGTGLITIQAEEPVNQTIIGSNPFLSAGAYALRSGDFEEGLSLTLQGLNTVRTLRDRVSAFNNLCAGYLGLGQFTKALESCDRALELNDRNWRIFNNRALALLGVGRIAAAREDLEKGLAFNPDSPTLAKVASLIEAKELSKAVTADRENEKH
ncbi:MAG: tetratricopeptide repeat protein [Gammaproteobacteria bacterium]|jgi:tetratricopeptide (TPR) repeat protein|nr:hypothetical protein [Chromatiales bacterium]MDP6675213.1 tetratricopeptide repeat protein [Gammaproteobacteria bacterium]